MKVPGKRGKDGERRARASEPQSEEALRVRARRRLIGAVALVLTGIVVFPLIFETQPRPVASNMTLDIPPQPALRAASAAAAQAPAARAASAAAAAPGTVAANTPAVSPPLAAPTVRSAPTARPAPTGRPAPNISPAPTARPAPETAPGKPPGPTAARSAQRMAGARQALAALEGKTPGQISAASAAEAAVPHDTRFIVQAGAYADAASARRVRMTIEHAGYRTYTQVVDTAAGKRIRVRVGPFTSHAQAAQVAARIRALGLSAVVLTL